ncbi:MAG: adenylate/guanylate cyclase domain-containing protein [Acidimicrobiia bacterium]|nr:adenylate/guanylate cyclase domain-containing protein [Acidimicrobiia bacterium]
MVTFLFTDIEGSTRRWEDDPDDMQAALAAHDETLQTAVEQHRGWLFKHTGDGVCAAFTSPRDAVDAAIEAQRALELPVRMGIASGEAELRGDDYFGPALNRAARVMSAAHGGQVLLIDSTATMVRDLEMVDLGARRLRDLSEPVGLFQACSEGLGREFPPLRTLDATPGNLRSQATSFVGRDTELIELEASVLAHRLVTLTGVGGVGKTRLALQVAAELAPEFPDGVWLVELAPVLDPDAVPDAVATALGVIQQPGLSVAESVAAALDGRHRLLVLDNCEHVLDAAADLVESMMSRSDTVKVVATSREGLRVPGEHLWPVPSLGLGDASESAGVALFVDRARAVVPDFSISDDADAAAASEICARLDGIPLAIELAAARMVSMGAGEVRDRLDDRFRLLTGARRGLERHQTLHHAVQWSYDLLDDDEKTVLRRCSVFSGGFDLATAVAVAGLDELDEFAVLDVLDALVRKSMLVADRSFGRVRYSLLETIRQFAEDQLVATGSAETIRDAHARHYAGCRDDLLELWNSAEQRDAYDWLDREMSNLRAAVDWADDCGDLHTAATIAIYAAFLGQWTQRYEPVTWAEDLLPAARAADDQHLLALTAAAGYAVYAGRPEDGIGHAQAAAALLEDPHYDPPPFGSAAIGSLLVAVGRPDLAWDLVVAGIDRTGDIVVDARRRFDAVDEPISLWGPLGDVIATLWGLGRTDEALALAADLVAAADTTPNPAFEATAHAILGMACASTDPHRAMESLRIAVDLGHESGNRWNETTGASQLCLLEAEHGDVHRALELFAAAINGYHDAGSTGQAKAPMARLAMFLHRNGGHEPAAVIAGYTEGPITRVALPELATMCDQLGEQLGPDRYATLTEQGAAMTPGDALRYTLEQIEVLRAEL